MAHSNLHLETVAITAGRPPRRPGGPLVGGVEPAVTFVAGGPDGYARDDAPSARPLESAIGTLEGGDAVVFGSGMAAVSAVLDPLPIGSVVGVIDPAYSGVHALLRRLEAADRLAVRRLDPDSPNVAGLNLLWLEAVGNPIPRAADLAPILAAARTAGATTVVDNTLATPLRRRPLEDGADYVVHSATKLISGHGDVLLGAVVTSGDRAEQVRTTRTQLGAIASPWECWLALRGLRTLGVRLDRAEQSAGQLQALLAAHPTVKRVHYPGFGTVVAIELADGAQADTCCAASKIWINATSLGGDESTWERRRRWPAESERVPAGLIRMSVGLEHVDDLWADLHTALAAVS